MAPHSTLHRQRAELEREWVRWATASHTAAESTPRTPLLRTEVAQSWQRSLRTVDPGRTVAPGLDDVSDRWARSPLRAPITQLGDQLRGIAEDAGFVAAVTDNDGTIVWTGGDRAIRKQGESVNFAPGGCWNETQMGTNGLSLALKTDRPVTVFSAEHLVAALHGWVCYSAPVHGPDGRQLGVLDLSSRWERSHPAMMTSVRALVVAAETLLRTAGPAPEPGIRLECLGTARLLRDGRPVPLPPRQLEILALLALEPQGYAPEQLHAAVYGDRPVSASTLKADVSHLRRATGGEIANRRYALTGPMSCDAVDLLAAIESGDTGAAVWLYRGPLLPGSDTPGVAEWRDHLDVGLRNAVLASDRADHVVAFGEKAPGDVEVHEHALRLLGPDDARRALVAARLHTALRG
ncbi:MULTISPECIES: sigma-54-dependent transcriptional regulator family protein [Nocardia]|uniref:transcriptional regulator n=1 Tax=Nocardia TaxID=1817 RepID=UPI000D69B291|nr:MULTISPECIES: transcriptional regulator [Nocardia]